MTNKENPAPHETSWLLFRFEQGNFYAQVSGLGLQWALAVPAFAYSGIPYVTDATVAVMADFPKPARTDCLLFTRPEQQSAALLQAIANLKMQTAMDTQSAMDETSILPTQLGESHAIRIARALERAVTSITGKRFIFSMTSYPKVGIGVNWGGKPMLFDGLPDGLRSIIGWLAHSVVMMDALLAGKVSPLDSEAVFLLDEIETALHPAWQRKILPAFQNLFPKAQIFVATHSPFVISSLNEGWIHQLVIDTNGVVTAKNPRPASKGDSYVTVVEDIMGVKKWFDTETEQKLDKFRTLRDEAYKGVPNAQTEAVKLAREIGDRSMELDYMMGQEVQQMDRQLAKASRL